MKKKQITTVGMMISTPHVNKRMVSFWRDNQLRGTHFWPSTSSVGRFLRVVDLLHRHGELKTTPGRDGWQADLVGNGNGHRAS